MSLESRTLALVQAIGADIKAIYAGKADVSTTVEQADIGTAPNQVPLNQYLGGMAFQHPESVVIRPATSAVPSQAGSMVFQLTSDTSLAVKVMGADGVVRSATLTLA